MCDLMVHSLPQREQPNVSPAMCALIPCSRRRTRRAPVSRASRWTPAANKALVDLISAIAKRKQCDPGNLNRSSRWN